jgi:MFS family permease
MAAQTRSVLVLLFLGVLMGALDIAIVGPALPALQAHFHVDARALSWMFNVFVLFNLVGTPLWAKLSDRLGRRGVYMTNLAIFGLGSLMVAGAPTYPFVLVGRAVQGVGASGIFPVASAVIGDLFPPERRGRALGLIGAVFGIAFIIGPIIGGLLLLLGWRWLFVINLPLALGLIEASRRLLPRGEPRESPPFDVAGTALLAVALGCLALGLSRLDVHDLTASLARPSVGALLAVALLLLAALPAVERRAQDPIVRPALLARRQVTLAMALALGAGVGEAASVFFPAFLVAALGVSESTASFMLLPLVLAMSVGAPVAGRLLDHAGSKVVIMGGLVLLAAGMVLLALAPPAAASFYAAGSLAGLGLASLLGAPLRFILLAQAQGSERAAAQGLLTLFSGVGQLLGGASIGTLVASRGGGIAGFHLAFLALAGLSALLLLLSLLLESQRAEQTSMRQTAERRPTPRAG